MENKYLFAGKNLFHLLNLHTVSFYVVHRDSKIPKSLEFFKWHHILVSWKTFLFSKNETFLSKKIWNLQIFFSKDFIDQNSLNVSKLSNIIARNSASTFQKSSEAVQIRRSLPEDRSHGHSTERHLHIHGWTFQSIKELNRWKLGWIRVWKLDKRLFAFFYKINLIKLYKFTPFIKFIWQKIFLAKIKMRRLKGKIVI